MLSEETTFGVSQGIIITSTVVIHHQLGGH